MPPCGAVVARSRSRGRSRGTRESRSKTGHSKRLRSQDLKRDDDDDHKQAYITRTSIVFMSVITAPIYMLHDYLQHIIVLYPHLKSFLIRSDELRNPNYGRSAIGVERPTLILSDI